jgi:hypothetical protein
MEPEIFVVPETKLESRSMTQELSGETTDALSLDLSVIGAKLELTVIVEPQAGGKSLIKYKAKLVSTAKWLATAEGGTATATATAEALVIEEVFPNKKEDWHSCTYDEFVLMAAERGGRLATRDEIVKHNIVGKSGGTDQWVPVSGIKDWVQIKDRRMHVSHVAGYGYPEWGDSRASRHYRGNSFVIVKYV